MIVFKYIFAAVIAILCNLAAQLAVFHFSSDVAWNVWAALVVGTITGLVVKYELDKRFIFNYSSASLRDEGTTFATYSLVGALTTAIFWGTELGFYWVFDAPQAKYIGGALGLAVGYLIKYHIDKRWVFITKPARGANA